MAKRKITSSPKPAAPTLQADQLLAELRQMIDAARSRVAMAANAELTLLYWRIGRRIHSEVLHGERAGYGKAIVATLSQHLVSDYGRGFTYTALTRMAAFFECFADEEIVATLSQQLSWSHFTELLPLKNALQREYYAEMCRIERWSVRTLRERIDSMLYERTALSRKPDELIARELSGLRDAERVTPELIMRDPYMLDFLGLHDTYTEDDLETAILREMESFLLELGAGFSFVSRQKRIQLDGDDFYLDLLFYNRKLKRLVAIELKVGAFKAEFKGQMELYLRWLDKHEREQDELPPLGIILCTGKKSEQIELLEMDRSGIHVAEYLTALPSRELLGQRLHLATRRAKLQLEQRVPPREHKSPASEERLRVREASKPKLTAGAKKRRGAT
jgi:predicted nuclease of restriction endonuclease-like (RecB) superfamily